MKYLDKDGLTYLWGKIKAKIPTKTSELTNDSGYITSYTETDPVFEASAASGITSTNISNWNGKLDYVSWDTTNNIYKVSHKGSGTSLPSLNSNNKVSMGHLPFATSITNSSSTIPKTSAVYDALSTKADTSDIPTKTSDLTNDSGFITSYTETDPVFTASAAHGISSSDITNWNSKTSNIGTITSVKMNGSTIASSGEANLGTVLTSHQSIKTINSNTITGTGNVSVGTITKVQANGTDVSSSGTANIPSATTSRYGVTQLSSSTSSTSTSLAATPSAVKSAYDRASTALTTANSKVGAWNYLDYISPGVTTSVTLPSSFNEILCVIIVDGNTTVQLSIVIPNDRLSSTAVGFRAGYYRSANVNAYARVDVTSTAVTLNEVYLNGTAKTSSSTVWVYYR